MKNLSSLLKEAIESKKMNPTKSAAKAAEEVKQNPAKAVRSLKRLTVVSNEVQQWVKYYEEKTAQGASPESAQAWANSEF